MRGVTGRIRASGLIESRKTGRISRRDNDDQSGTAEQAVEGTAGGPFSGSGGASKKRIFGDLASTNDDWKIWYKKAIREDLYYGINVVPLRCRVARSRGSCRAGWPITSCAIPVRPRKRLEDRHAGGAGNPEEYPGREMGGSSKNLGQRLWYGQRAKYTAEAIPRT